MSLNRLIRSSRRECVRAILICWLIAMSATARSEETVQVLRDIAYRPAATTDYELQRCKLDLYLPGSGENFATIVWFHGGGLQNGDKRTSIAVDFGQRFAREGIAVASVNYRLHPRVTYPSYIEDAAAAVAFVKREIEQYGGSPNLIFVSGHSAGGYLAAMLGIDPRYLARHKMKLGDVAGLMPVAGQMVTHSTVRKERGIPRSQPIIDEAAPTYHVSADVPPFLNFAGSADLPARAEENRYFAAAMKAAGHEDATYLEIEGRNHNTVASQIGEADDAVAQAMLSFIRRLSPED